MKNRDIRVYLDDIVESIAKIEEYCLDLSAEDFFAKSQVQDAVIRRLEIIEEAAKHIPPVENNILLSLGRISPAPEIF